MKTTPGAEEKNMKTTRGTGTFWLFTAAQIDTTLARGVHTADPTERMDALMTLEAVAQAWRRKYERTRKAKYRAGVERGLMLELVEMERRLDVCEGRAKWWRERYLEALAEAAKRAKTKEAKDIPADARWVETESGLEQFKKQTGGVA
jgi:hypothetical protein